MFFRLCRSKGYEDHIHGFRKRICTLIGVDPDGPAARPLAEALYLFAFARDKLAPVAMVEFYFYEDVFQSYQRAPFNDAYQLSTIAPMSAMIHVRSVIMEDEYRHSMLFLYLSAALVETAYSLGARFLTAATSMQYDYILGLHTTAGMRKLGTFTVEGSPQQLSLLELEPAALRASRIRRRKPPLYGTDLMREIKEQRIAAALVVSGFPETEMLAGTFHGSEVR